MKDNLGCNLGVEQVQELGWKLHERELISEGWAATINAAIGLAFVDQRHAVAPGVEVGVQANLD